MTDIASSEDHGIRTSGCRIDRMTTPTCGVHQLGYRGWSGEREPNWTRWTVIASIGVRRAWQNNWLKRMLFFAWLPAIGFGFSFFAWEQAALYPEWRSIIMPALTVLPATPDFEQIRNRPSRRRRGEHSPHRLGVAVEYVLPLSTSRRHGVGRRHDRSAADLAGHPVASIPVIFFAPPDTRGIHDGKDGQPVGVPRHDFRGSGPCRCTASGSCCLPA